MHPYTARLLAEARIDDLRREANRYNVVLPMCRPRLDRLDRFGKTPLEVTVPR